MIMSHFRVYEIVPLLRHCACRRRTCLPCLMCFCLRCSTPPRSRGSRGLAPARRESRGCPPEMEEGDFRRPRAVVSLTLYRVW